MVKDRYDFIKELLESKKLTSVQRERILLLTKDEIQKYSMLGKEFEVRIKRIETALDIDSIEKIHDKDLSDSRKEIVDLPTYYYPANLHKYLFDYNQNPILKSTCHEIDSSELENILNYCGTETYDFQKHRKIVLEAFKIHDGNHFAPHYIKAMIISYLTGKDFYGGKSEAWSSDNLQTNWSSIELNNWCLLNQGIPPNLDGGLRKKIRNTGFEINPNVKLRNGEVIQKFSDLVIYFKRLFHVRSDNSLKTIIIKENELKNWHEKIDFEISDIDFPNNVEIFTDVNKLVQSYNRIIDLVMEQNQSNGEKELVKLTLTEKKGCIQFSILHKNSIYGKSITNTIERLGTTYRNLIKRQVNGVCNFYLQADFENYGPCKIGIWDKPNLWKIEKPKVTKLGKKIGGVEHIFEIVKHKK